MSLIEKAAAKLKKNESAGGAGCQENGETCRGGGEERQRRRRVSARCGFLNDFRKFQDSSGACGKETFPQAKPKSRN
ncbi:hypothetical protein [Luteithermobacter gelatinilyticus]|uniref:hypothetical protein n=1 Tax=Luteithermobacter gelatinilyticus TaxID=2582913 RepID=UPI00143DD905|nr:hypothetical protein [Luteithermobacter gelatinilyticus]